MDIKKIKDNSCRQGFIYQFRIIDSNNRIKVIKSSVDLNKLKLFASNWKMNNEINI